MVCCGSPSFLGKFQRKCHARGPDPGSGILALLAEVLSEAPVSNQVASNLPKKYALNAFQLSVCLGASTGRENGSA